MRRSALLLGIVFAALTIHAQVPRPDFGSRPVPRPGPTAITWDFESGDLRGWEATGTAFSVQPTFGNSVSTRHPGLVINQQGNYWIGTYENHPDVDAPQGAVQGDAPVGTLLSAPFSTNQQFVSFLVGGGNDVNRLRVELLVQLPPSEQRTSLPPIGIGQRVELPDGTYTVESHVTGRNDEVMRREQFDLTHYPGRMARIRIVDQATGPWGHINVDDFQFYASAPGDVWIAGIEVSQGVQTYPAATVPLVGGKKTLVRAFPQSRADSRGPWPAVTARLTVRKGSRVRVHVPVTTRPNWAIAVPATLNRKLAAESFNFLLDAEETAAGETELEVRIQPLPDRPEADLANNVRTERVTFGPESHYWIYGARYSAYSATIPAGNLAAPTWENVQALRSFTENLLPVTSFEIRPFPGDPVPRFDHTLDDIHDQEGRRWAYDMLLNQPDPSREVYVLMPDAICSCGVEWGPVMFGHNIGGDAAASIMGHEVGHFFGLEHVQDATGDRYPCAYAPYETRYPYGNSWVGPAIGVRFAPAPNGAPFQLVDPGQIDDAARAGSTCSGPTGGEAFARYDIMSYGTPQWISDFTFRRMLESPRLGGTPRGDLGLRPESWASLTPRWKAPLEERGRDRFQVGKARNEQKPRPSANAPSVSDLAVGPKPPGSGKQTLSWKASDADGDRLMYRVDYSRDGGRSWMAIQAQLTQPSAEIDFESLPGSDQAMLRVTASDGARTTVAALPEPFRVARKAPRVTLDASAAPYLLDASAFDWEDGPLTAAQSYRWTSDRQGALGSGNWIVLSALTAGKHRITVEAIDKDGMSSTASTDVTATGH
jgi:hypothetical protein